MSESLIYMLPWCKCSHKWVSPDIQLMGGLGLTCSLQGDKVLHGTYWTINGNTQMDLTWRLSSGRSCLSSIWS